MCVYIYTYIYIVNDEVLPGFIIIMFSKTRLGKILQLNTKTKLSTQSAIWSFSRHKNTLINYKKSS